MPTLTSKPVGRARTAEREQPSSSCSRRRSQLSVYLLDLWSFIPYYMARLCASLRELGVDARLGSVRYHLERNYFGKVGLRPDGWLLDFGGGIRNPLLRRAVKSIEYVVNLCSLGLRFLGSTPDVLHVEYLPFTERGFRFEIWFLRWVRRLGVRVVYTVHNVTAQDRPDQHKSVFAEAYGVADALICHGEDARAQLIRNFGIAAEKIRVIPHGPLFEEAPGVTTPNARAMLGLPLEEPLVLCLGVISEYKGIPFLLDAWKQLLQSGGRGRLLIAGTGDVHLLSSIREKVQTEGLETSVDLWLHFVPVEQVPLLYQAADIIVYPYKAGTTSGALLTGMNHGKAIVATTLPFFREYLRNGENALLVEYGDVGRLASCLEVLIGQPGERMRLAEAVLENGRRGISWKQIAEATQDCYQNVVAGRT